MSFFSNNSKKDKANIHEESWDGKKTVSSDFPNVNNANNALGHVLAIDGTIIMSDTKNDDNGRVVEGLRKIGNSKLWGETQYEIKKADGSIPE